MCVNGHRVAQSRCTRLCLADPSAVCNSVFIIFLLVYDNIDIVNIPCIFVLIYMHYHVSNHSSTDFFFLVVLF